MPWGVCHRFQGLSGLLGDVYEVRNLSRDCGVGRAAEGVGLGVAEHVGETEEVAAFDEEVADGGLQLHAEASGDAVFEDVLHLFAVLHVHAVGAHFGCPGVVGRESVVLFIVEEESELWSYVGEEL